MEVVRAVHLARLNGIVDPVPGDRRRETWRFYSRCEVTRPCSASWEGMGTVDPRGSGYAGTFVELDPANCHPQGEAPVDRRVQFHVVDAGIVEGRWVVTRIEGTTTISFVCPGGTVSVGTLRFTGRVV